MARLINAETNTFENVAGGDVVSLFQSGKFGFRKGERIPVVSPDGRFGTVPAEKVAEAFQAGFGYDENMEVRQDTAEFGDRDISAFLAGAGRGATLGLSDVILEKTGLVEKRTLEGLEEHNPAASITGEIAGVAVPLLVPEPASTAGAVAKLGSMAVRTIGAPARAVARIGKATGKAVETAAAVQKISNPAIKFAAEKIAGKLAEGGMEGALFSGGRAISELALEEPEVLAEQTLGEMGLKVLTTAGEGAVFGAVTAGAVGGGMEASNALIRPSLKFLRSKIESATKRETLRAFAAERAARSLGGTKRQRAVIEQRLGQKVFSDDELNYIGGMETMGRDIRNIEAIGGPGRRLTVDASLEQIEVKLNQLGKQIDDEYSTLDAVAKKTTAGPARPPGLVPSPSGPQRGPSKLPKVRDFERFVRSKVLDPIADEPTLKPIHNKLSGFMDGWVERQASSQMTFKELWQIRRALDDTINWRVLDQSQYNSEARNMRDAIRKFTLDSAGDTMAGTEMGFVDRFKEMNRLYSSLSFAKSAAESGVAAGLTNRSVSISDLAMFGITGTISSSFVAGLGVGALNKFIVRDRGNQILSVVADRMADLGLLGVINRRAQVRMDGVVQSLVGGHKLPRDRIVRAGVGIQALLDNAPEADPDALSQNGEEKSGSDEANAYRSTVAELDKIVANPNRMVGRIAGFAGEANDLANSAPNAYAALMQSAMRSIQYLHSVAARPPTVPNLFAPKWEPNRLQIESFSRSVEAVNDPFTVLADVPNGFPSQEGVKALQAVYPALLQRLTKQLFEEFAASERAPSYEARVNLSRLLQAPIEPTASPVFMRTMQEISQTGGEEEEAEPQPSAAGGAAPSVSPSGERIKSERISKAMGQRATDRTQTPTQRVSNQ